ncbi:RNA polymerase-binding transcription factor DksA [Halopseudomonas salina]|uniref:RNA polymerase-binding transcription factor DksA n=1 Tax=Halopseudomonas salina TaxID=1323744 RepID=A0ABQ1PCQ4_9GAMM|nr:TraR/DksA C4-type zinc finger protein [Halopseudomonas salina]GGC94600.1 RNA polymerase-binding transcription factor DksA [Halopseudomonas salina]
MGTSLLTKEELLAQPADEYMSESQLAFFKHLLTTEREELRERIDRDFQGLREYEMPSDPGDVGSAEEQRQSQLHMLEREKRLLDKIDQALDRVASGEYGWCAETGDPIGLRRLLLRPTATLSIEAKQRQEQLERHVREV